MLKILLLSSVTIAAPGFGPKECKEICVGASSALFPSRCIKSLICPAAPVLPEWKTSILQSGKAFVKSLDGIYAPIDWKTPTDDAIPGKYIQIFNNFETCVEIAFNLDEGVDCISDLKRDTIELP